MSNLRRRILSVIFFAGASVFISGCGYNPQYIDSSYDLWAPWDAREREFVVSGDATAVVERLGEIGWRGEALEFSAESGVNDSTLEKLKAYRNSGRVRFSGLILRDASGCSSQPLCGVSEWRGMNWAILWKARFDAEASPRFSQTMRSYNIEGAIIRSPLFWDGVGASNIESLDFSVSSRMLDDLSLLRMKSQKGQIAYELTPTDYAARDKIV